VQFKLQSTVMAFIILSAIVYTGLGQILSGSLFSHGSHDFTIDSYIWVIITTAITLLVGLLS